MAKRCRHCLGLIQKTKYLNGEQLGHTPVIPGYDDASEYYNSLEFGSAKGQVCHTYILNKIGYYEDWEDAECDLIDAVIV